MMNEAITKITELRHERDSARETVVELQKIATALYDALSLLTKDVRDYPAWERPCHAVDESEKALALFDGGSPDE